MDYIVTRKFHRPARVALAIAIAFVGGFVITTVARSAEIDTHEINVGGSRATITEIRPGNGQRSVEYPSGCVVVWDNAARKMERFNCGEVVTIRNR